MAGRHTPGPWTIGPGNGNYIAVAAKHWDAPLVSRVTGTGRSVGECAANADLIAAAPDMLAALQLLVADLAGYEAFERPCYAVDVAIAAIAKAEGRS